MAMNLGHRLCCSSNFWAKAVEQKLLPWLLGDLEFGRPARILHGDGTELKLPEEQFNSVAAYDAEPCPDTGASGPDVRGSLPSAAAEPRICR
jgi:hypothetical protein